jgi:photosystem II stability/assembly factor-like uncharacterized protein
MDRVKVAVVVVCVVAVGVGGFFAWRETVPAARSGSTTTTTTEHSTTTTSAPPTTTTSTTTSGVPAGGPPPSTFDPISFTAVSASDYWLLGAAPCATGECPSIVRTADGGGSFVSLPAPASPIAGTAGVTTLRFATLLDGYAFGGPLGPFWDTHDGGEHWSQPGLRGVEAFGIGNGYVFAATSICGTGSCPGFALRRSSIGSDDWTDLALPPAAATAGSVSMTVHGASVWVMVTTSTSTTPSKVIWRSTDSGTSFTSETAPCIPGLGGTAQASSTSVLWAVCPTGMMASSFRSVNGGASWSSIATPEMPNSARIAPAGDTVAVVSTGSTGELLRTSDGGTSFVRVRGAFPGFWAFLGFTDTSTGSGLLVLSTQASKTPHVPAEQLWRSTDGGVDWHPVTFPA